MVTLVKIWGNSKQLSFSQSSTRVETWKALSLTRNYITCHIPEQHCRLQLKYILRGTCRSVRSEQDQQRKEKSQPQIALRLWTSMP